MLRLLRHIIALAAALAVPLAVLLAGSSACVGDLMCGNTCKSAGNCGSFRVADCPVGGGCRVSTLPPSCVAEVDDCKSGLDEDECKARRGCVYERRCN